MTSYVSNESLGLKPPVLLPRAIFSSPSLFLVAAQQIERGDDRWAKLFISGVDMDKVLEYNGPQNKARKS
ncbi:hypothetical protein ACP70R_048002 [Stipagrostis hirtigluma subsp. patula]